MPMHRRNTRDDVGTVRVTVALVRSSKNVAIPGNITRSLRIHGTQVSTVVTAIEDIVDHIVRGRVEPASGVMEDAL